MSQTILVITSKAEKIVSWLEREKYVQDFCANLSDLLDSIDVLYTTYDDLYFEVCGKQLKVTDTRNSLDLKDLALVHFKNWEYDTEEAPVAAHYLRQHNVPFYNTEVGIGIANGKLSQMFQLRSQGVPVPDSFYARRQQLMSIFSAGLPKGFTYPVVMKANDGSKGHDNHLIRDAAEALEILSAAATDKQYIVQNFIPNDGDYRILFMGLESEPLVFLRKGVEGSHLNNTSQGGSGKFMDLREYPAEYIQTARKAAEALKREIGGVDLMVNKETGAYYILEVNGTPQIATGFGTDVKLSAFAQFIEHALVQSEEE